MLCEDAECSLPARRSGSPGTLNEKARQTFAKDGRASGEEKGRERSALPNL